MKVVVSGAGGLLGSVLVPSLQQRGHETEALPHADLDVTDPESIQANLPTADWVINCAAYTAVDAAESHEDEALLLNAVAPGLLAAHCKANGSRLLHLSTDYVFDGSEPAPYTEDDETCPQSIYGATKLAGELAVQEAEGPHIVARVQSLFGPGRHNFVRMVVNKLNEPETQLRIVNDQTGSPTYTRHLAEALVNLVESDQNGIVHVSSSGSCTWYDFACTIRDRVKPGATIEPVTSEAFDAPAKRPANAVMSKDRYTRWTGVKMPSWEEGLTAYLEEENFET